MRRTTQGRQDPLERLAVVRDAGPRRGLPGAAIAGREVAQILCAKDGKRFVTATP